MKCDLVSSVIVHTKVSAEKRGRSILDAAAALETEWIVYILMHQSSAAHRLEAQGEHHAVDVQDLKGWLKTTSEKCPASLINDKTGHHSGPCWETGYSLAALLDVSNAKRSVGWQSQ